MKEPQVSTRKPIYLTIDCSVIIPLLTLAPHTSAAQVFLSPVQGCGWRLWLSVRSVRLDGRPRYQQVSEDHGTCGYRYRRESERAQDL